MKSETSLEEITSHSSKLTNERIDAIIRGIDVSLEEAWNAPTIPAIKEYHSAVWNLYISCSSIFDDEQTNIIMDIIGKYRIAMVAVETAGKSTPVMMNFMLSSLDRVHWLMKYYMQSLGYFFKFGLKQVKGLEAGLKVVIEGGGCFGGEPLKEISTLPDDTDSSEAKNDTAVS